MRIAPQRLRRLIRWARGKAMGLVVESDWEVIAYALERLLETSGSHASPAPPEKEE